MDKEQSSTYGAFCSLNATRTPVGTIWFTPPITYLVELIGILDILDIWLLSWTLFLKGLNLSRALHFYIAHLQVPWLVFFNLSKKSSLSRVTCLLLSLWHLFDEDPGHCGPACVRISTLIATVAASNPEPHSHLSVVNVVTVTFNVAVTMKIVVLASLHVKHAVNRSRRAALSAIEGEIPTATAAVTSINPEGTSKVDMEGSVCEVLHELAVLCRENDSDG